LPRDARDTLFLLTLIGGVVALLSPHLPLWCQALTLAVLLWRGTLAWQGRPLPARAWRLGLLALTIGATLLTHRTILGRDAGVTLIVVLLALKTLELRARRDAFVVFFLALFTLLTHFFYSQSLLTAAGVLLAVWGLLTGLVNAHMTAGKPPLWLAARTAGTMALAGAPVMLALFLFFPRVAPLWGIPGDAMTGRTGLSSSMQVGRVARLAQDTSVAFRVKFDGAPPPVSQMYFRGPVLSHFDGTEWTPTRSQLPEPLRLQADLVPLGAPVNYEVTLEPGSHPWVMVLDATPRAPTVPGMTLTMTPELQWLAPRPLSDLVRYRAQSFLQYQYGPTAPVLGLQDHLGLPPGYNPRTLTMAQAWRQESRSKPQTPAELVDRALHLLATGGYSYTLEPGLFGKDSSDEFWFDRKSGFCEHIAAAFVILMRSLDIPARVVTGYQGGERNGLDGFWTVRQSDAHAWAEVWLPGRGWVRVDPTAAVAPNRVSGPQRLQAPQGTVGATMATLSPEMVARLRQTWEAVNNRWNQWVLNYSQSRQLDLLKALGFESPSWVELGYVLAALVAGAGLVGAAWALWERQQHDPWLRLLQKARQRATRLGLQAGPHTTARQLAQQLQTRWGQHPHTPELTRWLLRMEGLRYAAGAQSAAALRQGIQQLAQEFSALRWPGPRG
jgi:transglutaminase-like putative cysteine protease